MSFGNWNQNFEVGGTVYFYCDQGWMVCGEIISIHGPWLWVTDGGGMYTEHYDQCAENPDDAERKVEAIW